MYRDGEKIAGVKDSNGIHFAEEVQPVKTVEQTPWKILIADDEDEIHAITRLVFQNFRFEGRSLEFLSAYSGAESKRLMRVHPDMALVLLDVVMEEETSGLEVVRYIREDLENRLVRIVLRTGQPGQAPEREVSIAYDINDYKEKTDLTVPKLFTTVLGSLRAYRDLRAIEQSRQGLERIVIASTTLFELRSLEKFALATLTQLSRFLASQSITPDQPISGFIASWENNTLRLLSGIGKFAGSHAALSDLPLSERTRALLQQVRQEKHRIFQDCLYIDYFPSRNGPENVVVLQHPTSFNEIERNLLSIFSNNIAVAFENMYLNQAIVSTQKEVIFTLGKVIDTRSKEPGNHVKRVAVLSYTLARYLKLSEPEAELLRLASPMHDIGKIGIPDAILNKRSPLNDEELTIFKTHPQIGYNILKDSTQTILKTAAMIALQHHEHWDGSGYPQGLREQQIHMFARITRLVDAFDLLSCPQFEDVPCPVERIVTMFQQERGKHFDPHIVDTFVGHLEEFQAIHAQYPDTECLPDTS